jgi:putative membrane protein
VSLLFAWLHHVAAFTLVAALAVESVLLRYPFEPLTILRLQRADVIYGIAAVAILAAGFGRALFFEKGWAWYAANPAFAWKLVAFLLVGLVSIYPSLRFMQWRGQVRRNEPVKVTATDRRWLPRIVAVELGLIAAILACAILMARGIGMSS